MLDLASQQAIPYFAHEFQVDPRSVRVTTLGGGVSNIVVLIETPVLRAVAKQSLEKLRVEQEWFCPRARIFHEAHGLRTLEQVLPKGAVPRVLLEDRGNFLFAMEAAPAHSTNFKTELLAGRCDLGVARRLGYFLGQWVAATAGRAALDGEFGGLEMFHRLRLDPYYCSAAARHPDLATQIQKLIEECTARRVALTHGDFSPKNVLCFDDSVWVLDLEVVHYGDPSFDAGFMTNHFLLKAFFNPANALGFRRVSEAFWTALRAELPAGFDWFEPSSVRHLGALMLARIDGKSPAEYLRTADVRDHVREAARSLIRRPPEQIDDVWAELFP